MNDRKPCEGIKVSEPFPQETSSAPTEQTIYGLPLFSSKSEVVIRQTCFLSFPNVHTVHIYVPVVRRVVAGVHDLENFTLSDFPSFLLFVSFSFLPPEHGGTSICPRAKGSRCVDLSISCLIPSGLSYHLDINSFTQQPARQAAS